MTTQDKQQIGQRLLELVALLDYPTAEIAELCGFSFEKLENCYVRLFINDLGGVSAPPFAGCYVEKEDRLNFMSRFSGFCREAGIEIDASFPPDYIPMMVEVLVLLLSVEGSEADVRSLVSSFYQRWPRLFAETLKEHDKTGLYADAGKELCRIIEELPDILIFNAAT
ncbi:MAG: molecular chaperone TorD family protein [Desulfuromonadales bacterium]|nr:molecular chaperone TorD family protein [Desulfuromonadales bacterium]